jgi:hypothetical protein
VDQGAVQATEGIRRGDIKSVWLVRRFKPYTLAAPSGYAVALTIPDEWWAWLEIIDLNSKPNSLYKTNENDDVAM